MPASAQELLRRVPGRAAHRPDHHGRRADAAGGPGAAYCQETGRAGRDGLPATACDKCLGAPESWDARRRSAVVRPAPDSISTSPASSTCCAARTTTGSGASATIGSRRSAPARTGTPDSSGRWSASSSRGGCCGSTWSGTARCGCPPPRGRCCAARRRSRCAATPCPPASRAAAGRRASGRRPRPAPAARRCRHVAGATPRARRPAGRAALRHLPRREPRRDGGAPTALARRVRRGPRRRRNEAGTLGEAFVAIIRAHERERGEEAEGAPTASAPASMVRGVARRADVQPGCAARRRRTRRPAPI